MEGATSGGIGSDPALWSAVAVAAAIRERRLGSREYLEGLIARIERLDGPLNTVVTLDLERARSAADVADQAVGRGGSLGPLHGVAMTIKDSFQTRGLRTTSGAPELADFVPAVDAMPVARLRAAGAIVLGKTNLPIWAGDMQSYNQVFGTTNNPWDPSRSAGGSSGGAAGALAAGFTPLELGSDIGGSIRGPASTCGVCGHKPSYGIVPALGQIPGPPGTLTQADLAVAGPMAREVSDLELALEVLAGPDDWHAPAYRLELPPKRRRSLAEYRVAVWCDEVSAPIDPEVRERVLAVAKALADAGATVDSDARPAFELVDSHRVFRALLGAAFSGGHSHHEIDAMAGRSRGVEGEVAYEERLLSQRHREWLSWNERRLQLRRKWHEFFRHWDVVLAPVLPTTAIAHDHSEPIAARTLEIAGERRSYLEQLVWVGLPGVAYLPVTTIPAGLSAGGLPVGIQIIGPFLEDRTTLDVARQVSVLLGGYRPPPGFG